MANYTDHYSIHFNADTTRAKQSIQELYDSLNKLGTTNPLDSRLSSTTQEIKQATLAAQQLAIHLSKATNVNTGKLNLKSFHNELTKNNQTLASYKQQLSALGPEGSKAFRQLASQVIKAEQPVLNLSTSLKNMGQSLINSFQWSISSGIINTIISMVKKSVGYMKSLDRSLNNIRIVTKQSASDMDRFAQKANAAAKALKTTTTAYADAALIFYQQGLGDQQVEERTQAVIKLSNVTGETASDVSSYMTAIWNNFDNGSKSLEYYADVMTALGAATASSTEEIAAGLDKFAAIANTVGLSYEYATSALATVVAETRQSADVVGTAFKTIFSRLEGLQLGETLDDGTTLNKYSAALATVGVSIKDQSGQLKNMDQILDELGEKWQSLGRDQQVALAQTVAGTRQYTQLISLMENYETFRNNISIAQGSEGELNAQAEIYAESWEASSKRVKASAEAIYDALLDEEFFISFNNGFSTILSSIGLTIEGMGGFKGILPVIALALNGLFGTKISGLIDNFITRITTGKNALALMRQEAANLYTQELTNSTSQYQTTAVGATSMGSNANVQAIEDLNNSYQIYLAKVDRMNEVEKEIYQTRLNNLEVLTNTVVESGNALSTAEQIFQSTKNLGTNENWLQDFSKKQNSAFFALSRGSDEEKSRAEAMKNVASNEGVILRSNEDQAKFGAEKMAEASRQLKQGAYLQAIGDNVDLSAIDAVKMHIESLDETLFAADQRVDGFVKSFNDLDTADQKVINLRETLKKVGLDENAHAGQISAKMTELGNDPLADELRNNLMAFKTNESDDYNNMMQSFRDGEATLQATQLKIENIKSSMQQVGSTSFTNSINSVEKLHNSLDLLSNDIDGGIFAKLGVEIKEALGEDGVDAFNKLKKASADYVSNSRQMQSSMKKIVEHQKNGTLETEEGQAALAEYQAAAAGTKTSLEQMGEAQNKFSTSINNSTLSAEKCKEILTTLGYGSQFDGLESSAEELRQKLADVLKHLMRLKEEGNNPIQISPTIGESLTGLGTSISKVAMGLNAMKSAFATLSSEDATPMEKFLSVLTSIGMILPMVTSLKLKDNIVSLATSIIAKKTAAGKIVEAGGRMVNAGAAQVEAMSVMAAMAVLLPYIAIIAAVIAIIALLIKAVKQSADAYNKDAIAAKNAAKAAQELQTQFEEVKGAYEDLKSSIEDYQGGLDALKELTAQTQEWRDAVREVNSQALDLIATYPELAQYANWEGGILKIDEDGINSVMGQYEQKMRDAQNVSNLADINAKQAIQKSQQTDLRREYMGDYVDKAAAVADFSTKVMNPTGLLFGDNAITNVIDSLAFAPAGLLGTKGGTQVASAITQDAVEKAQAEFDEGLKVIDDLRDSGNLNMSNSTDVYEALLKENIGSDLAKALSENTEAVLKQIDANEALVESEKALVKGSVMDQYSTKEGFQNSNYQEAIAAFASESAYVEGQKAYEDTLNEDWAGDAGIFGDTLKEAGEKAAKEYMSYLGIADYEITDNGENLGIEYIASDGKTEEITLTKEMLASVRQMQAQQDAADQNYEQILAATNKIAQTENGDALLRAYGESSGGNVKISDLQQLNLNGLTLKSLGLSQSEIDALGGEAAFEEKMQDIEDGVQRDIENANKTANSIVNNLINNTNTDDAFDKVSSDLTVNQYKDFVDQINALGIEFGEEGAQKFIDETLRLKESFGDNENIDAFIGEINEMDLTSEESSDAIRALAEEYDISGAALDTFIDSINDFVLATEASADRIRSSISTIQKILKDLEFGSTIDDKKYNELLNTAGTDLMEEYFVKMADNTYMLIGSADEFQKKVEAKQRDDIDTNISSAQHNIDQITKESEAQKMVNASLLSVGGATNDQKWTMDTHSVDEVYDHNLQLQKTGVAKQLKYLQAMQAAGVDIGVSDEQMTSWTEDLNKDTPMSIQTLEAIAETVNAVAEEEKNYQLQLEEQKKILQDNIYLKASMSQTLDDLDQLLLDGVINTEAYKKALDGVIVTELQKLDIDVEEYNAYVKSLSAMGIAEEQAKKIAAANLKINKGIETLAENWEDWSKELKSGNKASSQYVVALQGMKDALEMILDLDADKLSDSFYQSAENLELIEKAAQGDAEAIEELQQAAAQDLVVNMRVNDDAKNKINEAIEQFQTELPDLTIGATLDSTQFGQALMEMLNSGAMTVEQMQDLLNSLGFEPEINYVPVPYVEDMEHSQTIYDKDGNVIEDISTQIDSNGMVYVPTLNAKKTSYQGPPSATLNQSNKKNSGGGGGKEKKKEEDEIERYHETERELEALEREVKQLGDAKDDTFGQSKVALIDQEIEALERELETYEKLEDEIESYLAQDRANIAQYGATFDERGNINNYDEMVGDMLAKYNAGSVSEEEYEGFKDYLEQYEETLDKWYENQDNKIAKQREIVQKEIEKIDAKVEIDLELSEKEIEWIEYQLGKLEDTSFAAAESIDLISSKVEQTMKDSKTYQTQIKDLYALAEENVAKGLYVETGGFNNDMKDKLNEATTNLLDVNNTLLEARKEIQEQFGIGLDEMNSQLDEQIGRFDSYGSILSHYTTILGLSGKSIKDAGLIIDLGNKNVENSINKLESTYQKQEALEHSLAVAQQKYEEALARGDSESVAYWQEEIEKVTIMVEEGKEQVLATFEETLQAAADNFAAAVEQTVAVLSASLTKFDSLNIASDQYEKQKTLAEQFLDANTQAYELSKLMRNINGEIAKTDNLATKTKLRDVLEEINEIQSSNAEITQYDLDMLNAKYELRLAEIALEEAQNAKSQVRLTQTAGGGWGYVYTADQNQMDNAQQNYEDKLYAIQQLSEERISELSDNILANYQEFTEALGALKAEEFESKEAYLAEVDRITQYYTDRDAYLHEQLGIAVENSGQKYSDTLIGEMEQAETWEEAHSGFMEDAKTAVENLDKAYANWETQVSETYEAAGLDEKAFKDQVVKDADEISKASEEVATKTEQEAQAYSDYLTKILAQISEFQSEYGTKTSQIIAANENIVTSTNNMVAGYARAATAAQQAAQLSIAAAQAAAAAWAAAGGGGTSNAIQSLGENADTRIAVRSNSKTTWANGNLYVQQATGRWVQVDEDSGSKYGGSSYGGWMDIVGNNSYSDEYLRSLGASFDTGGYTGEWGPRGKFAMLHEKEIVLNKSDTANLLTSIEIVRSIAQQLDALSQYQRMFDISTMLHWPNNNQPIEQNVYITAEFPEATDRHELEEAFKTLMNYSSQYINRYNK